MNKKEEKNILRFLKKMIENTSEKKSEINLKDIFSGSNENNLGIEFLNPAYIEINENQNKNEEWIKINKFLDSYMRYYSVKNDVEFNDLKLEFINYGKTELVYVLSDKKGNKNTLLVKQPSTGYGEIKKEAENLIELSKSNDNIIVPIEYFENGEYELYTTPYIYQARCIASYYSWGMYVPEPFYHFESFTKEQEKIVNICMIAKLVSLYDFKTKQGICNCKLGGGDFILKKGWENTLPTVENTLNNLYLVAARKKIYCEFEDYLLVLKNEFSKVTINEKKENIIINLSGKLPMQKEDIEFGIEIGKKIIENKNINKVNLIKRLKCRLNKTRTL